MTVRMQQVLALFWPPDKLPRPDGPTQGGGSPPQTPKRPDYKNPKGSK